MSSHITVITKVGKLTQLEQSIGSSQSHEKADRFDLYGTLAESKSILPTSGTKFY